jgi:hypothetical protein
VSHALFLPPEVVATVITLAALTYMIGVALLSVPSRRIRGLAWGLVYDGATNIAFLAIVMAIPFFIGLAVQILTGQPQPTPAAAIAQQYTNYNCWLGTAEGCSSAAADAVRQAYTVAFWNLSTIAWLPIFGHALTTLWWAFLNPTLTILSGILTFLWILYFLGAFVRSAWLPLTSVGAILYGLPGRIGRGAGAGLIATMLVFYVALPFMPVFVNSFCIPGAGTAEQTDCPPPPTFGSFIEQLANANQTTTNKVVIPITRLLNPNVKFQTSDMNGNPLGPILLTVTNGQGQAWQVWTLTNGTRLYGFPNDTYTVVQVEYLNVTIPVVQTVFAAPESGVLPVNISLPIIPFSVTFLLSTSASKQRSTPLDGGVDHGTHHYAPAFLNIGEWKRLQYVSLTYFYSNVAEENFVDVTVQGTPFQDGTFVVFFTNSSAQLTIDNSPTIAAPISILPKGVGLTYTYNVPAENYTVRQLHMIVSGGAEVKYTGLDANPTIADMVEYVQSGWMNLQVEQTASLATFSIPFLLRWLLLPTLYLFILGIAASDLASALGGRRIPIPV